MVSATAAISYKGVFDQTIYDQSRYLNRHIEENVTEEGLKSHLHKMKVQRLAIVLLNNAQQRVNDYQAIIEQTQGIQGIYNYFIRPLASLRINLPDPEAMSSSITRNEAKLQLFKLIFEMRLLKKGLDKEPICDLEYKYIIKKRKIQEYSPEICDQVEKILLLAREEGASIEFFRAFIENAIAMPHTTLEIPDSALQEITEYEEFGNFDPKLQKNIQCIANKLIIDSQQSDDEESSTRGIYYFYGNPGTGKSTTAKKIPELLNLPYFVRTIKTSADLSANNLEGSTRTIMSHEPGMLANTLMSKNKDGESYNNAVLIIEDFDRLLFPENGQSVEGALTFLLDYLDPNKKDFINPYFGAKIKISRLSIILTANQQIPIKPANPGAKDPYAALRSRVTEIHFPDFTNERLQSICTPHAELMGKKYGISKTVINRSKKIWIEEAIKEQKNKTNVLEPRDLKRQIENIVNEKSLEKGKKQRISKE